jgi:hypothetical protein
MIVEKLKDQWICSCGNWVDLQLSWCPDCCEEKLFVIHGTGRYDEEIAPHTS